MSDQTFPIRRRSQPDAAPVEATYQPTLRPDAAPTLPGGPPAPPGFDMLDEIGRGGMGVVFRARDRVMDREVAVKILRDADPAAAERFVEEARITGQLQHPGIPAVYQVGQLADGRPFLAMKLIKGETLDALLRAGDPVNVPAVFEGICQAVGYAHAHGVIHRDLKPQNVMVGSFGEVQVMDWGLAKVLSAVPCVRPVVTPTFPAAFAPASWVKSARETDGSVTQAGSVLGTPAYMPPEQAAGDVDRVDPRSDVFGLGAVLCRMLTGKPPFEGESAESVRQNALHGRTEPALARLDKCGADPELVVLCMRCLSVSPADRPTDARELASEVAKLRAAADDRAKQAEQDKVAAGVRSVEAAKRRRQALIGTAAVLLMAIVSTAAILYRSDTARRDAVQAAAETEARRAEAEQARDQARRRYDLALAAFDQMIFAIQTKLATRPGTLELRKQLLTDARGGLLKLRAEAERTGEPDRKLLWSYFRMGTVEELLGDFAAARHEFETGHALATRLADADPGDRTAQADLGQSLFHLGESALLHKETAAALERFEAKLAIDRRLTARDPVNVLDERNLGITLARLGAVYLERGDVPTAHRYHEERLALSLRLADANSADASFQRDLLVAYEHVGESAGYLKRFGLARDCYQKMHEIGRELLARDPQDAVRLRDVTVALGKLGNLCMDTDQPTAALDYYRSALDLLHPQAAADPKNVQAQTGLFIGWVNVAEAEAATGRPAAAAAAYRSARAVIAPLHARGQLATQFRNALTDMDRQIAACDRAARREPAPPPRTSE